MEHVLDVYARPYNPAEPVVGMDETTKQMVAHVRAPLPAAPGRSARYDTLYRRQGVAVIFMFFEPLRGWRRVTVDESKTRLDWAHQIARLVEEDYPQARKIHLVLDNLNTHAGASLYKAFAPEKAHRLLQRIEFHYTPKHGSWLNIAEIELSILSRQCLNRRIADLTQLRQQTGAWETPRNRKATVAHWQFKTPDARIKLRKLYPTL
jgi:hypothetical protein